MKKKIRADILARRDAIPAELRKEKSLLIQQALLSHPAYKEASQVLSYVNFRSEAETAVLLETALRDQKELYCPRVCRDEPEQKSEPKMEFYRITELSDLKRGAYGILEPAACEERKFVPCAEKKVLMIVPGAAFDRNGARIGYGGGYYDRYLAGHNNCFTIAAFLFSEQLVDVIPTETHDFAVDLLVTEYGVHQI